MRVAVITRYFPCSHEPWAGHSAYETLRFLTKRCELKVFYPETRYPKLLTPQSKTDRSLDVNYRPGGVDVEYIFYPALPVVTRPLNGWSAARSVLPSVRAFKPDILLNYIVYPDGFAALRLSQELKVPVVVTAIGSDLNRIPDPLCRMLTQRVLREADALITVSGDLRKTAINLGANPEKSYAILNGCDTSIFHPRDRAEARRQLQLDPDGEAIVFVGRLDVAKGLRELIEAVAQLHATRPKLHCYLVGDGHDRNIILEHIAKFGAERWITLVPPCTTDQVAVWMAAANIVTLPSYREGCPNVVIEALAAGRPVVASDVGGIPELMDASSGRMVPAMNSAALAGALEEVLAGSWDPEAISGRHSRGWSDVSDDVQRILERVLAGRKQGPPD
jgi:teichuronic acid biosynthesis glycosyltransferase TuaC